MNRSAPLKPGGPLARRTALTSTTPLHRSPVHVSRPSTVPAPRRAPRRATGPTRAVRDATMDRDGHVCVCCGRPGTDWDPITLQHRVNRGNGGSTAPWVDSPGNLIACHLSENLAFEDAVGEARDTALRNGWKVERGIRLPADVPVLYPDGARWFLDAEGGRRPA